MPRRKSGLQRCLAALVGIVFICGLTPVETGAQPSTQQTLRTTYDAYLIGPGDALEVELQDIPEYSGVFSIGPDGTIYLPRLRGLYVEGLTVEELRYFLTQQFATYVRNPQVFVRPGPTGRSGSTWAARFDGPATTTWRASRPWTTAAWPGPQVPR